MLLASCAEVVSIGAVLPFLAALTSPEQVFEHPFAQYAVRFLDLTEPRQLLFPLTVVFAIAALFSGALRWVLLWAQTRLSFAIGADLSISMYRRTLYQPYSVHLARNSSEVIVGISSKANIVVGSTILPLMTVITSTLMLVAILLVLFAIDPLVTAIAFTGFSAIYLLIAFFSKKRIASYGQRISYEQNQIVKALQEGLGGIRDVLIDGTQAAYCKIYSNADVSLRRAIANIQIISASPRYGIESLGMALIAALAYFLAGRSAGVVGAIPVLGALALGAQRLLPILQQMYSSWTSMRGGQASLSDTIVLLEQPLPEYADAPLSEPIAFHESIALTELGFRYSPSGPRVIQGLNLSFPKGSHVGFIGTTGSGKSTLLDILMGLLCPTEGCLEIDGVPITLENIRPWQAHIAHVPQSIFLADTTIAENIAFGVTFDQIDHERVRHAAQKAQIAQTIESWDKQYRTVVGERGIRLSGGQRQRIGIARALYKRADVIVFDEATSALDNGTEREIMQAIEALGDELTIIMVAHRLTTLKGCDQIVELESGAVKQIGTYDEIIGKAIRQQTIST